MALNRLLLSWIYVNSILGIVPFSDHRRKFQMPVSLREERKVSFKHYSILIKGQWRYLWMLLHCWKNNIVLFEANIAEITQFVNNWPTKTLPSVKISVICFSLATLRWTVLTEDLQVNKSNLKGKDRSFLHCTLMGSALEVNVII